ncbi:alanyl-tRNA editing protein [Archangium violaceum]|uniref:alanyl-tRNA editing protein n=1 Tax=Archangium violaceum TaxID=83451 RepID=UPI002B2C9C00|nr:alanyl-tRNA editing protein [Archangium violaceum]
MTVRLYLEDSYQREFHAEVLESADGWCVLSRTAFYPGGGGQPCDRGHLSLEGDTVAVSEVREDDAGRIWHRTERELAAGQAVRGTLDWSYRHALMRHHGLMHVVNTVARQHFGGVITGVQLGPEESRIDFKLTGFTREQIPDLESRVNDVLQNSHTVTSSVISEEEFRSRPELIRTLNVLPPIVEGKVRIVEIAGFDAQACGGTHVHSMREIGQARIRKFDNKGKDNKRFYWTLTAQ